MSYDTVFLCRKSTTAAAQYLGELIIALLHSSQTKGASGTTDEDFVLLSLRVCL